MIATKTRGVRKRGLPLPRLGLKTDTFQSGPGPMTKLEELLPVAGSLKSETKQMNFAHRTLQKHGLLIMLSWTSIGAALEKRGMPIAHHPR